MPEFKMNILDAAKMELVVARFDFKYVHKLMTKMKWEWATNDGGLGVPDIDEMKNTAYRLLMDAYSCEICSTGGFEAEYKENCFYLRFIAEDSNSYIDGEETEEQIEKVKKIEIEEESPRGDDAISLLED
jgi:hypothetical protein